MRVDSACRIVSTAVIFAENLFPLVLAFLYSLPCDGPLQTTNREEGVLHNGRKGGTLFGGGGSHLEGPLPFLYLDSDRCLTLFGSPARP